MNDTEPQPSDGAAPLRLGFTRGTAPSKWAKRWELAGGAPLELVPIATAFGRPSRSNAAARSRAAADPRGPEAPELDMVLERCRPGERPAGSAEQDRARHAMRLYTEAVALVLPIDHELAELSEISVDDLALVTLLDHPDHCSEWPAAEPWADPSWMPKHAAAALELVATGAGGMLLPRPLARHLVDKRRHAIVAITGEPAIPGTTIWVSWSVARDATDVQQLAGIMRGRTARSSRPGAPGAGDAGAEGRAGGRTGGRTAAGDATGGKRAQGSKKPGPKPGSRGAQLAAAKEKAERAKAERRKAKKRR